MKTYFFKHLNDLKYNIFIFINLLLLLFLIFYYFSNQTIYLLIKPLLAIKDQKYFIFTNLTEIFLIKIYLSTILSIILTFICSFLQIWLFLSTGLYKKENKLILQLIFIFILFLFFSIKIIYFYIIPNGWNFFLEFKQNLYPFLFNIYFEPKLYNYIILIIKSLFITFIVFQYPFIVFICLLFKVIEIKQFVKFRKFFYLKIIIISSLIAPPDFWSQFIISLILIIFIEFFILFLFLIDFY